MHVCICIPVCGLASMCMCVHVRVCVCVCASMFWSLPHWPFSSFSERVSRWLWSSSMAGSAGSSRLNAGPWARERALPKHSPSPLAQRSRNDVRCVFALYIWHSSSSLCKRLPSNVTKSCFLNLQQTSILSTFQTRTRFKIKKAFGVRLTKTLPDFTLVIMTCVCQSLLAVKIMRQPGTR